MWRSSNCVGLVFPVKTVIQTTCYPNLSSRKLRWLVWFAEKPLGLEALFDLDRRARWKRLVKPPDIQPYHPNTLLYIKRKLVVICDSRELHWDVAYETGWCALNQWFGAQCKAVVLETLVAEFRKFLLLARPTPIGNFYFFPVSRKTIGIWPGSAQFISQLFLHYKGIAVLCIDLVPDWKGVILETWVSNLEIYIWLPALPHSRIL